MRFLAGGAAGLIVHEGGHLAAGFAFNANPGFERLDYGYASAVSVVLLVILSVIAFVQLRLMRANESDLA